MEQNSDTTSALVELAETLKLSLPDDIVDAAVADGDLTVTVQRPSIVKVLKFLRDDANCQFSQWLICVVLIFLRGESALKWSTISSA